MSHLDSRGTRHGSRNTFPPVPSAPLVEAELFAYDHYSALSSDWSPRACRSGCTRIHMYKPITVYSYLHAQMLHAFVICVKFQKWIDIHFVLAYICTSRARPQAAHSHALHWDTQARCASEKSKVIQFALIITISVNYHRTLTDVPCNSLLFPTLANQRLSLQTLIKPQISQQRPRPRYHCLAQYQLSGAGRL